ncbi:ribokinase [Sinobacterium caligoides]|uniref:Ribokinase n=1 Tax=Sinobacterium caligoides TaxID=933926 RepID=A0A3N2DPV4_9GAMM|nr:ribokinase [Sinobacterium caligoides]ROS01649.1 ribokinase [Sinobacterium caligoides]
MTITVVGSINVDHVMRVSRFPQPGETLTGSDYQIAAGGKGANQAVAAARSGAKTQFIACAGNDAMGVQLRDDFIADGIDVSHLSLLDGEPTGLAMITVSDDAENMISIYAGANACLSATHVEAASSLIASSEILLMQLETPIETLVAAAKIARAAGVKVVLNPAPATALPDALLGLVDMITPNQTEAELLTGIAVVDEVSARLASEQLHRLIPEVVITMGGQGAFYSSSLSSMLIAGFKVAARDTTAAGDTFNGALVTALVEGQSITAALRFAHAAAALSVTKHGAQPSVHDRDAIEAFLVNQG